MKIRTIASITFISLIIAIAITAHVVTAASGGTEGKPLAPGRIIAALPAGRGAVVVLTLHEGTTYSTVYAMLLDEGTVMADVFFWLPNEELTLIPVLSECNLYLFASWPGGENTLHYWWRVPPGYCIGGAGETLLPVVVK